MFDPLDYTFPVFWFGNSKWCTYCGDTAECKDHVIPVSCQNDKRTRHNTRASGDYGPWCWACSDCNRRFGGHFFNSFQERCQWISDRLSLKALPVEWHIWEANQLDYSLRSYVLFERMQRLWYRSRADYYQSRDFYLGLEKLLWELSRLDRRIIAHDWLRNFFSGICADTKETLYRNRLQ